MTDKLETTDDWLSRSVPECPYCGDDLDHECVHCRRQTVIEAGARFEFASGHAIDVHELWNGQWLYQVWPPGVKTQGQFDRLLRMKAKDFEQEVMAKGGMRVR